MVYKRKTRNPHRGSELKAPFGELVVTRCGQMAARADCGRTLARSHGHFDTLLVGTEVGMLVNKTSETMTAVENRDQFHGAEAVATNPLQIGEPKDR
jgi:hypothetical protein